MRRVLLSFCYNLNLTLSFALQRWPVNLGCAMSLWLVSSFLRSSLAQTPNTRKALRPFLRRCERRIATSARANSPALAVCGQFFIQRKAKKQKNELNLNWTFLLARNSFERRFCALLRLQAANARATSKCANLFVFAKISFDLNSVAFVDLKMALRWTLRYIGGRKTRCNKRNKQQREDLQQQQQSQKCNFLAKATRKLNSNQCKPNRASRKPSLLSRRFNKQTFEFAFLVCGNRVFVILVFEQKSVCEFRCKLLTFARL